MTDSSFPGVSKRSFGPSKSTAPKPTMTVAEGMKIIAARKIDRTRLFTPPKVKPRVAGGIATNNVAGPASIAELARSLKYNPDLMYEWVYNNIEHNPTFGHAKGALGCLIDGNGNNFDQCDLLFQLLTEAGLSPSFVLGNLQLSLDQANGWLGTDPTDGGGLAFGVLNDGGYGVQFAEDDEGNTQLFFSYLWIQVEISGTTYVYDPSFKQYTSTSPIDIGSAMGFNEATFISDSESGSTITTDYVSRINETNLRADMTTYAENLQAYILANNPAAFTDEIYGGRRILQISNSVRQTSLPYEAPGDTPTIWSSIPDNYRAVYDVLYADINVRFFSSDVHGAQLTLFFNDDGLPVLTLDGTLVATGTFTDTQIQCDAYHPYLSDFANQTYYMNVQPPPFEYTPYFMLACSFGPMSKSTVDYRQQILRQAQISGGSFTSEPVLGAYLNYLWCAREAQAAACFSLLAAMNACTLVYHHNGGNAAYRTASRFPAGTGAAGFDIQSTVEFSVPLTDAADYLAVATTFGVISNALEMCSLNQATGLDSVATPRILSIANNFVENIYQITPANQSTILPLIGGYSDASMADIQASLNNGASVILSQLAPQQEGNVSADGWVLNYTGSIGGILADMAITGGGGNAIAGLPYAVGPELNDPSNWPVDDPIRYRTGDYYYKSSDISVGSGGFPYQLEFQSIYDSRLITQNLGLGFGWYHNWTATATAGSDLLRGLGSQSPVEAATTVAAMFVINSLAADQTYPTDKIVLMELASYWWSDQSNRNSVTISLPDGDYTFVKLAGGTYHPQIRDASTLTLNNDGTYTHTTPDQIKRNFNAQGQLSTWVFPNGVTVALTYTSGLLTSISNGMGRQLNLTYSGTVLQKVDDGNGRSVQYAVNGTSKQLTSITDPLSQVTTFSYDSSSRLVSYFLPQNPTSPMVRNTYGSLNRVASQLDVYGNLRSYYFAGDRTEIVDPASNSVVYEFDNQGNLVQKIDQLGNATINTYDGLGRQTESTLPEGNSTSWTYDIHNNKLTATYKPKPGSTLTNIVETWTYDATYNKKHTFIDGNGKTWTWNYDSATGNLLSAVKPVINSQTPEEVWTYNTRGQALTYTDETSIVRKLTYDTATEKLLTVVDDYGVSPHLNLTTQFGYDAVGNRNSVTDPNLNTTTYLFDNNRQLKQKTDPTPFSYVTTYGYDLNGNQTTVQRQTGIPATPYQTYTTVYTKWNQVYTVTDPASNVTTNTYDTLNRLLTITDAQSRVTTFAYDARSKLYTVKDATNTISETRTYTNNGHLYQLKDARSETTTYSYDGFDRPDKTTYADASYEENVSYDKNGNLLTYRTRSGNTIVNTFDVLNRLATKTPTGEAVVTTAYDLHGRLLSATTPVVSGNPATGAFSIAYDTAGRVKSETTPDSKVTQYGLDSNGNLTKLTYPDGYYVTRVFDQLNRLTNIKLNGATASAIGITYDELSRRNVLTYGNGATSTYTFALNEDMTGLAAAFVGSSVTFGYGFNKVHQETSRSVSDGSYMWHPSATATTTYAAANSVNEYPTVGGATYTYDANANLKTDGTWTYTYDTENHLLSASKTGTSASYVYDPLQRHIQKTVGTTKSRYVYAGWHRIADYDGTAGTLQNRYVYGDGLDELLISISSSGTLTYFHADRQGSIVATTNSSGAVVNELKYGPCGESAALVGTTFGYTGQRYDAETGLYYYKMRHYSAVLGRFLQPDPIGYMDSLNLYAYVENDPLNNVDPFGLYVVVTYDRSTHTFTMVDTETGEVFRSSDIFSGNGPYRDNPNLDWIGGHGPLPGGGYQILPRTHIPGINDPNIWEYPLNGNPGRRGGFTIHPGSRSNGCITFKSDIKEGTPGYPHNSDFDKMAKMLENTYRANPNDPLGTLIVK